MSVGYIRSIEHVRQDNYFIGINTSDFVSSRYGIKSLEHSNHGFLLGTGVVNGHWSLGLDLGLSFWEKNLLGTKNYRYYFNDVADPYSLAGANYEIKYHSSSTYLNTRLKFAWDVMPVESRWTWAVNVAINPEFLLQRKVLSSSIHLLDTGDLYYEYAFDKYIENIVKHDEENIEITNLFIELSPSLGGDLAYQISPEWNVKLSCSYQFNSKNRFYFGGQYLSDLEAFSASFTLEYHFKKIKIPNFVQETDVNAIDGSQ